MTWVTKDPMSTANDQATNNEAPDPLPQGSHVIEDVIHDSTRHDERRSRKLPSPIQTRV